MQDRSKMYSVGSLFYAIYFWVSFPMFFVMDEYVHKKSWTLWEAARDALAAGMAVTILLDLWRIALGPLQGIGGSASGLPWMSSRT